VNVIHILDICNFVLITNKQQLVIRVTMFVISDDGLHPYRVFMTHDIMLELPTIILFHLHLIKYIVIMV